MHSERIKNNFRNNPSISQQSSQNQKLKSSTAKKRVTFANIASKTCVGGYCPSINNNNSNYYDHQQRDYSSNSRRPPINNSTNNNNPKDRRLTRTSLTFGAPIGQQRQTVVNPHQSETRAAYKTPPKRYFKKESDADHEPDDVNNSRVRSRKLAPGKFQEYPPFSLRKATTSSNSNNKNKIIDAGAIPELMQHRHHHKQTSASSAEREHANTRTKIFVKKGISSFSSTQSPGPSSFNTFGILENPKDFERANGATASGAAGPPDDRFRFIIDMSEYHNNQIELWNKGRKLVIEGHRPQEEPWISERKTIETIELPPHVHADNLRIDRDENGLLYFQEAWKF